MKTYRWSLWDELMRMNEDINRTAGDSGLNRHALAFQRGSQPLQRSNYRNPMGDIWETDKEIIASMEMPGLEKKDIQINIEDNILEIKGEKMSEVKSKNNDAQRYKKSSTRFYKRVSLPAEVDANKANATYNHGVLELKIPKKIAKKHYENRGIVKIEDMKE